MRKCLICILVVFIIFTGCNKDKSYKYTEDNGIKSYKNYYPADDNMKIKLELTTTIDGDNFLQNSFNFCTNSEDEIFLLDYSDGKIHRYNHQGKLLNSFCSIGQGPGEAQQPKAVYCYNDTISVLSFMDQRNLLFSKDGKFLKHKAIPASLNFEKLLVSQERKSIVSSSVFFHQSKEKWYVDYGIRVYDPEFKEKFSLCKNSFPLDFNVTTITSLKIFTVSADEIFISIGDENNYAIACYDFQGVLKYQIKKRYSKLKYSKAEIEDFKGCYEGKVASKDLKFKKAVKEMWYDKTQGLLWVASAITRQNNNNSLSVDIYKKGILQNTLLLPEIEWNDFPNNHTQISIDNNKFYCLNRNENILKVYKIKYLP